MRRVTLVALLTLVATSCDENPIRDLTARSQSPPEVHIVAPYPIGFTPGTMDVLGTIVLEVTDTDDPPEQVQLRLLFGVPLVYFAPSEAKQAVEHIVFDEWGLPRRSRAATAFR